MAFGAIAAATHAGLPDVSTPHVAADLDTDSVITDKILALAVTKAKIALASRSRITLLEYITITNAASIISTVTLTTHSWIMIVVKLTSTGVATTIILELGGDGTATNYNTYKADGTVENNNVLSPGLVSSATQMVSLELVPAQSGVGAQGARILTNDVTDTVPIGWVAWLSSSSLTTVRLRTSSSTWASGEMWIYAINEDII